MLTEREQQLMGLIEENPMVSQQELAQRLDITRSSVAVHISNLMKKGAIQGKGYILRQNPFVVVVGGQNVDISGRPHKEMVPRDSNPGEVRVSFGGVGRNIAHNLAMLEEDVKFITALGEDLYAGQLAEDSRRRNVDLGHAVTVPGGISSTYLFIANHQGEMELAVNDMDIYKHITPSFLREKTKLLDRAALCVADTNIPEESLATLAEICRCPLFVDTVSTAKAVKLQGILGKIHTLKPNRIETQLLTGIAIEDEGSLHRAADALLEMGVQQVFVSLGEDGVYCTDGTSRHRLPVIPTEMVDSTGAGDSFLAGLAWAWRQGYNLEQQARIGLAAGSICLSSRSSVSEHMSIAGVLAKAGIAGDNSEKERVASC